MTADEVLCAVCSLPTTWHRHGDGLWCPIAEEEETPRCYSRGDGLHEYGRCKLAQGHEEPHEDAEGYSWW